LISEYAIFGTIILTLFLLFTISLIRPIIKGVAAKEGLSAEGNQAVLHKIQLNVRIIFFFLIFILLGKVIFLLAFPFEINSFNYVIGADSDAVVLFHLQIFFLILYGSILSLVVLHDKLKPAYRYYFLNKVLLFTLIFSAAEVLISSIIFIIQQYQFIWSSYFPKGIPAKITLVETVIKSGNSAIFNLLGIGLFIVYTVLFVWNIRRFNLLLQKIIAGLVLFGLLIDNFLILDTWRLLFGASVPSEKLFSVFLPSGGMSATIWFALVVVTAVSQILTFFISQLKDKFIAVQLNTHYRLQLNRISYYGFGSLLLLLLWPRILFWFFQ